MESELSAQIIFEMVVDQMIKQEDNNTSYAGGYCLRTGDIYSPLGVFIPPGAWILDIDSQGNEYDTIGGFGYEWSIPGMEKYQKYKGLIELLEDKYPYDYFEFLLRFPEGWNHGLMPVEHHIVVPERLKNYLVLK